MGYKDICLNCPKAYNRGTNHENPYKKKCSDCGSDTIPVDHKFQPPKRSELKKWEVVSFLIMNGFRYGKLFDEIEPGVFNKLDVIPKQ